MPAAIPLVALCAGTAILLGLAAPSAAAAANPDIPVTVPSYP
jgi:hypothetical protein